jgi:nucleoside-diphosphate-sugar epimerase
MTGAAGYIGGALRERLRGHDVRLTDVAATGEIEAPARSLRSAA